ncbi:amino acid oxidase [Solibacillus sp. FSL R7-0682]|uniref:amino acid oxidase n=1 Tax=Solibacillus sp. FSL R7-0682 TaxID=2921690 RepID=UPI0030F932A7
MRLNMILSFISIYFLLTLSACSNNEVKYDGEPLKIAVIGDIPELNNKNIHFETISLDKFSEDATQISTNFDAVMITPVIFEEASDDRFVDVYSDSEMPIIFFDSPKRHFPFIRAGATYETARWESLNNGSHTTIYLSDIDADIEDVWYFYLKDEKELDDLYKEIFQMVETL